jgi:hypothetical protein
MEQTRFNFLVNTRSEDRPHINSSHDGVSPPAAVGLRGVGAKDGECNYIAHRISLASSTGHTRHGLVGAVDGELK